MKWVVFSALAILIPSLFLTQAFEVPDEQSHFATLHFLNTEGRVPTMDDKQNLSLEEQKAEYIFGIMTDGTNKYSYHPDYRLEYTQSLFGKHEQDLINLNTPSNRTTYTIHQAAIYPPLYYQYLNILSTPFHKDDILIRLYVARLVSVTLTIATVVVGYYIGGYLLALLMLFYPMTSYIGIGVNSDNLHNLLFTIFVYYCYQLIKKGLTPKLSLAIGIVIALDLLTKPQGYIMFPILALALLTRWQWSQWRTILSSLIYLLVPILLLVGYQEIPKLFSSNSPYMAPNDLVVAAGTFKTFLSGYLHNLSEVIVWYWGVYKWLGVLMPTLLWRIGIRLFALAALGTLFQFGRDLMNKRVSYESKIIFFAIGANVIYAGAIFWFDWQFFQEFGRSLGIQARYYMPILSTQMLILIYGLRGFSPSQGYHSWVNRFLILFFTILVLVGTYTAASSYYDLSSVSTFITQVSQYKPVFAKGSWWYLYIPLYFAGVITMIAHALRQSKSKK